MNDLKDFKNLKDLKGISKFEYVDIQNLQNNNKLKLKDMAICFYNGISNVCIGLKTLMNNIIIHDYYYYDTDTITSEGNERQKKEDITIIFCPYSYTIVIYYGNFVLTNIVNNNNIVIMNLDTNKLIQHISGSIIDKDETGCYVRKISVRVMTIKQILINYIDSKFLQINDANEINNNVIQNKCDNINFSYGIEYITKGTTQCKDIKHTILISKNDYDYDDYKKYFKKYEEKLIEKGAILIPCDNKIWQSLYPNTKIINLND